MSTETRDARLKRQITEQYAAIGRLAVEFEHLCERMRFAVRFVRHKNGQNPSLGNSGMTAKSLRAIFGRVLGAAIPAAADKKTLQDMVNRIEQLAGHRNTVLHAPWFTGYTAANQEDFSEMAALKYLRDTATPMSLKSSAAEIEQLASEAKVLNDLVLRLTACVVFDHALVHTFAIDKGGHVTARPAGGGP